MQIIKKVTDLLGEKNFNSIIQLIKFGIVGVSNTAVSYGIDMLCYYVVFKNTEFFAIKEFLHRLNINTDANQIKIIIITAFAFFVSVTNSYFWNNRFVFKSGNETLKSHLFTYLKTVLCYGITGLVLSPVIKIVLSRYGVVYFLASIISIVISVPINFVLNKFWAFKK